MYIELPDEFISDITRKNLKENYNMLKKDFEECVKTKKSMNYYSPVYREEKKFLSDILKNFKSILEYYGIKDENTLY